MIHGMTGFGSSAVGQGKIKGVVEIKSVNHRYLDISYYLPTGFSLYEEKIQKILSKDIKRGRVNVVVKITDKPEMRVEINKGIVSQYTQMAKALSKEAGIQNNLGVADLLRLPGVVEAKEMVISPADLWPTVEKSLIKAVHMLMVMRKREGKAISADILSQLKKMKERLDEIKTRTAVILKEARNKMTDEEFASIQKSNDVNEEIERLTHYIDEAKALLKGQDGVGKKLDFIAQEMQRETNTIGSKVQDKIVAAAVISIKSKVEKIREQANNVE